MSDSGDLPAEWIALLELRSEIEELASDLAANAALSPSRVMPRSRR
jgi:hypothetical protein